MTAVLQCLTVKDMPGYAALFDSFSALTAETQEKERVEDRSGFMAFDHQAILDPCCMLQFRVRDDQGNPIKDFDVILTAGAAGSPNHLPPGFFIDRQRNHLDPGSITYYINHARMTGAPAVIYKGKELRPALKPCTSLGLLVIPFPQDGFVLYQPAVLAPSAENLANFIKPNQTTLVDVVLRRFVREGVYRLSRDASPGDFTKQPPGLPVE